MKAAEEDELSPEEGELPAQEGHTSGEGEEPLQGEDELPEEIPQLGVEVKTEEGPKLKKYRRVRVKKKAPLEREIKEMHGKQRMRSERMACLRLLQQDRREKQKELNLPEPDTAPQPRTPSPSSVDWKAAEEETKRQFAAKAAGRKILTYMRSGEIRMRSGAKKESEKNGSRER